MKIPKTVQESKLYQKSLQAVYQKGLKTEAYNKTIKSMGEKVAAKAKAGIEFNKVAGVGQGNITNTAKASEVLLNSAIEKSTKKIKGSPEIVKQIQQIAKNKALISSGNNISNADEALKYYNKALFATKTQLGMGTAGNMAVGYFANPWMEQQYGIGAIRAGLGIGTTVGTGVIASKLLSDDYSNNYYDNLENQNNNGIQNY